MCMSTQVKCTCLCLWLLHLQLLSLFYVTLQYLSRYCTMKTEVERQGSVCTIHIFITKMIQGSSQPILCNEKKKENEKDCWTLGKILSFFFDMLMTFLNEEEVSKGNRTKERRKKTLHRYIRWHLSARKYDSFSSLVVS